MILLECWLGVRIKFKPVDNPTTDSRIFGCHPLNFIGGTAKFSDKVLCRTANKKTRSAWRLYFSTLPVEHFALGIGALRGAEIRLPLGCSLDLQLIGNMVTVLYNPQPCYLQIGQPRTRVLPPSHLPPVKKRRLGNPEDEQARDDLQAVVDQLRAELDNAQQMVGGASSSREDPGRSVLEGQLAAAAARAEDALAQLREWEQELRTALARTTTLEAEMAELRLRPEAAEVERWRQEAEAAARWQQEAAEATRWRQEAEEAARLRTEAGDLRTQLGEERHRGDMLRSEMRGLERALALVGRSRSATSQSGIPSGSAGHYLTGSSGRRRNEEEERRRRERAPEGSETGPRGMAPPSPRLPEGTGESG
ncbi:hypothetical protein Taro_014604 [Colocasia esculenta]|uniref:Uncharacterized protein n=1 Tax=Colocasia esculenta TaxID=4460 RepID=A0A843UJ89_COLES|nr:hypothetical protein [Colocasia esculenta]